MGEGSVDEFGEALFDDGVAAVLGFGLDEDVWAVGERGKTPRSDLGWVSRDQCLVHPSRCAVSPPTASA